MTKILISRGYGAGWSTWAGDEFTQFYLTYAPFIKKLEAGKELTKKDVEKFLKDLRKEFGIAKDADFYSCTLGYDGLVVEDVDGPFHIHDYDGYESVQTPNSIPWETL